MVNEVTILVFLHNKSTSVILSSAAFTHRHESPVDPVTLLSAVHFNARVDVIKSNGNFYFSILNAEKQTFPTFARIL